MESTCFASMPSSTLSALGASFASSSRRSHLVNYMYSSLEIAWQPQANLAEEKHR